MSPVIKAEVKLKKRSKLFRRYFKYMIAIVLCCTFLVGTFVALFSTQFWLDSCVTNLLDHTGVLAARIEAFFLDNPDYDANSISEMRLAICSELTTISQHDNLDIYLVNNDGTVLWCKDMLSDDLTEFRNDTCVVHSQIVYPQSFIDTLALSKNVSDRGTLSGVYEQLTFFAASGIYVDGKMVGFVAAAQPVSVGVKEFLSRYSSVLLISLALSLVISFVFSYAMTFTITNPITEMSEAMKNYARGNFEQRMTVSGNDEISELAESFNSMADVLAVNENTRRSFVANVSHELRTPMTSIGGYVKGILDGAITPENERKYLRIVADEIKRLSGIITSMLNMSKIEAGELEIQAIDFRVLDPILNTLTLFEQKLEDKNIEITGLDEIENFNMNADKDMLTQVLYNLIENAVKYTPQDGEINFFAENKNGITTVKIRNYGAHLSQEQCSRIFERFYKVDKSRSLDVKSVGLGLNICKSIIEMHGGKIGCKSDNQSFTEFYFSIPTRQSK